jgi:ATP-dependent exoDNAse (exonuclease V) alpha subunit
LEQINIACSRHFVPVGTKGTERLLMPNYHLRINIISRGNGASAVCKAAYRAAEMLTSEYDGRTHDYTRKQGIIHKEILLPENAPPEYKNRSVLWNAVEQAEKQINAQLAREIEISLPRELTKEQNIALARKFADEVFVKAGMCADICIHDKNDGNPHAHIMLTMRPFNKDGTWGAKSKKEYILDKNGEKIILKSGAYKTRKINTIDWNDQDKAEYWRKQWADYQNAALAEVNEKARVDHRSYARQGIEQIPTVHLGAAAHTERKGIRTEQGDRNRRIENWNRELRQIRARIKKLKKWLYEQPIENPPSMGDVLRTISANNHLKSRAKKIADLQTFANIVNFLKENNLDSIDSLADTVTDMHQKQYDISGTLKKQERRLITLDTHLANVAVFNATKPVYKQYIQLDPKKRESFKQQNAVAIGQYEAAHKYLTEHLNGHTKIPKGAWKAEREKLLRERFNLAEQYYDLKADVRNVEVIRRGAEQIINRAEQTQAPKRSHRRTQDHEL